MAPERDTAREQFSDDEFIAAMEIYWRRADAWGRLPPQDLTVPVDGRAVPLGPLVQRLQDGAHSASERLREAFDRQGMLTVHVDGRTFMPLWCCPSPHAVWTSDGFVAAMNRVYNFGDGDLWVLPGEFPPHNLSVRLRDVRDFPLGRLVNRLAGMGLRAEHVTPDMREALGKWWLPIKYENGRIYIDERARLEQQSHPLYKEYMNSPVTVLACMSRGWEFTVKPTDTSWLSVRMNDVPAHRDIDTSNWRIPYSQIQAGITGSAPGCDLADTSRELLRASIIKTLTREVEESPPSPAPREFRDMNGRRYLASLEYGRAATCYENARRAANPEARQPVRHRAAGLRSAVAGNSRSGPSRAGDASRSRGRERSPSPAPRGRGSGQPAPTSGP